MTRKKPKLLKKSSAPVKPKVEPKPTEHPEKPAEESTEIDLSGFDFDIDRKKKSLAGAKGLYNDEILPKLEMLAAKGLNNADIARSLCIGNRTFYEWLIRYPQFAQGLAKYRGVADIIVENALYLNAIGYKYKEEIAVNGVGVVEVERYRAGDTKAQMFFLNNRMPHRYKATVQPVIDVAEDVSAVAIIIRRREV